MDNPLISIIVPVYNVEKYINRCLDSILDQTYSNIEIILVDDGSKDSSGLICDEYARSDSRVKVFHGVNRGLSAARNFGIAHSTGKYFVFVDSDDCVDRDYVEYLLHLIMKYGCRMSVCQHRVLYENGKISDYGAVGDERLTAKECIRRLLYNETIDTSAWAKMYEHTLFDDIKYPEGKLFEDIATTYKPMIASGDIAVGNESKYIYIYRRNSIVTSSFSPRNMDLLEMTDLMCNCIDLQYPELVNATLRRRGYARFSVLNKIIESNDDKYTPIRKELVHFLKANALEVCKDGKTPTRDKIAYICLYLGYPVYKLCWKIYLRVFK